MQIDVLIEHRVFLVTIGDVVQSRRHKVVRDEKAVPRTLPAGLVAVTSAITARVNSSMPPSAVHAHNMSAH
ncbi:hypothetical protein ACQ5SK_33125 [Bradyrhizobium japonicum]